MLLKKEYVATHVRKSANDMTNNNKVRRTVLVVFGTRPEAVKMAPVILELRKHAELKTIVCVTGQHREMCLEVLQSFDIEPDYNLRIMREKQTLTTITCDVLERIEKVFESVQPDIVLVHGDTSSSVAAALAAFYRKIPVGHVEAGLRSHDRYSPFPEEMNRQITSRLATLHFAPTEGNVRELKREGITENVYVTGNTVIDTFAHTLEGDYTFQRDDINNLDWTRKVILVTAHRRENWGDPLVHICRAILRLNAQYDDLEFVYPVHLNPTVRGTVFGILENEPHVTLIDPLDIFDMHNLMKRSFLVMTDSGGLQEEAPHLGKPVVVLRTETERPEAVKEGTVVLAGVNEDDIFDVVSNLIDDPSAYELMAHSVNPYGDGHASERIASVLLEGRFNEGGNSNDE